MVYVNEHPVWADVCWFRIMWHSEVTKKDPNSDQRPCQLWIEQELCFSLKLKIGK